MSADQTSDTSTLADQKWVRWVDPGLLINMSIPGQWLVQEAPLFELMLLGPDTNGKRAILTVQKIEVPAIDRMIIEGSEQQTLAQLRQDHPEFKLLDEKVVTLDEVFQATIFRVSWTNSKGLKLVQNLMLVSGGKALFQLTATIPASEVSQMQPLMDRMFLSLRFRLRRVAEARAGG
jgi:hypothetical protein